MTRIYFGKSDIGAQKPEKVGVVVSQVGQWRGVKLALLLHFPVLLALDLVLTPVSVNVRVCPRRATGGGRRR